MLFDTKLYKCASKYKQTVIIFLLLRKALETSSPSRWSESHNEISCGLSTQQSTLGQPCLEVEQAFLDVESEGVTSKVPVLAYNSVTWNKKANRIPAIRHAHSSSLPRLTHEIGLFRVGDSLTIRDFMQRFPSLSLKRSTLRCNWQGEWDSLPSKVLLHLLTSLLVHSTITSG